MPQIEKKLQTSSQRLEMIEELYKRYGRATGVNSFTHNFRFWWKKYVWMLVLGSTKLLKRVIDIIVSGLLLILLSLLFSIVAIAIKLTDNGPVLFWQTRVGKWGREIQFPKFRSMVVGAEKMKASLIDQSDHQDSITFKMKHDPRITWIGRIIRKVSIDELPQLWNVLKGEMSLVGPRPPLPKEVAQYTLSERRRLDVTPGITSIWAISGRGDIPFDEQVELDVQYIESQSLWMDILILIKTIPAVLMGKGAY